jgi:hypothetical protein
MTIKKIPIWNENCDINQCGFSEVHVNCQYTSHFDYPISGCEVQNSSNRENAFSIFFSAPQ